MEQLLTSGDPETVTGQTPTRCREWETSLDTFLAPTLHTHNSLPRLGTPTCPHRAHSCDPTGNGTHPRPRAGSPGEMAWDPPLVWARRRRPGSEDLGCVTSLSHGLEQTGDYDRHPGVLRAGLGWVTAGW